MTHPNTERRYARIESNEEAELMDLLGKAGGKSAALLEFAEYVRDLDQPVPADVSLRILKLKARELLESV